MMAMDELRRKDIAAMVRRISDQEKMIRGLRKVIDSLCQEKEDLAALLEAKERELLQERLSFRFEDRE